MSESTIKSPLVQHQILDSADSASDEDQSGFIKEVTVSASWGGSPELLHFTNTDRKSVGSRSSTGDRKSEGGALSAKRDSFISKTSIADGSKVGTPQCYCY